MRSVGWLFAQRLLARNQVQEHAEQGLRGQVSEADGGPYNGKIQFRGVPYRDANGAWRLLDE